VLVDEPPTVVDVLDSEEKIDGVVPVAEAASELPKLLKIFNEEEEPAVVELFNRLEKVVDDGLVDKVVVDNAAAVGGAVTVEGIFLFKEKNPLVKGAVVTGWFSAGLFVDSVKFLENKPVDGVV